MRMDMRKRISLPTTDFLTFKHLLRNKHLPSTTVVIKIAYPHNVPIDNSIPCCLFTDLISVIISGALLANPRRVTAAKL